MSAKSSLEKRLRAYTDAVIRGSAKDADEVVAAALADGVSPSALYLGVLVPSQAEVGKLWHAGVVSVPEEHAATQITLRQCDRIRAQFPVQPANGLRVVVASNDGDLHWLGLRAEVRREVGFDPRADRACTPEEDDALGSQAGELGPDGLRDARG